MKHTKRCDRCGRTVSSSLVHDIECLQGVAPFQCKGTLSEVLPDGSLVKDVELPKISGHPVEVISTEQVVDEPARERVSATVIHKDGAVIARRENDDQLVLALKFIHNRAAKLRALGASASADLLQKLVADLRAEFSI